MKIAHLAYIYEIVTLNSILYVVIRELLRVSWLSEIHW